MCGCVGAGRLCLMDSCRVFKSALSLPSVGEIIPVRDLQKWGSMMKITYCSDMQGPL